MSDFTAKDNGPRDLLAGKRLVIFDLDDTLITYSPAINDVWPNVFAMTGATGLPPEQVGKAFGDVFRPIWRDADRQRAERVNMRKVWTYVMGEACRTLGVAVTPEKLKDMAEAFAAGYCGAAICLPDTRDTLQTLKSRGLSLALLTNGDSLIQRGKLQVTGLAATFDYIQIEGEFGRGKPDAEAYANVLKRTGATPDTTLMVGDNLQADVVAAMQAGIDAVWFTRHGKPLPDNCDPRPTGVITKLPQLLAPIAAC